MICPQKLTDMKLKLKLSAETKPMKKILLPLFALAGLLAFVAGCGKSDSSNPPAQTPSSGTAKIKIGFIVKQPEEPWFQLEWKFAQQAADKDGFELIKIAAPDGEKALGAVDSLAASGAQGFVIC